MTRKTFHIDCPTCGEKNTFKLDQVYRWLFGSKRTQRGDVHCGLCDAVILKSPKMAAQPITFK